MLIEVVFIQVVRLSSSQRELGTHLELECRLVVFLRMLGSDRFHFKHRVRARGKLDIITSIILL